MSNTDIILTSLHVNQGLEHSTRLILQKLLRKFEPYVPDIAEFENARLQFYELAASFAPESSQNRLPISLLTDP